MHSIKQTISLDWVETVPQLHAADDNTDLVNPVIAVAVSNAPVQRVWRQHENEVGRLSNAYQKVFVKPADPKTLDVNVDAEAVQSEVDFQQTSARY